MCGWEVGCKKGVLCRFQSIGSWELLCWAHCVEKADYNDFNIVILLLIQANL